MINENEIVFQKFKLRRITDRNEFSGGNLQSNVADDDKRVIGAAQLGDYCIAVDLSIDSIRTGD